MLRGAYNRIKNAHAFSQIPKVVEQPFQLGMGDAERMKSVPIASRPIPPAQKVNMRAVTDMTATQYDGAGAQVSPDDFPKLYWMGE